MPSPIVRRAWSAVLLGVLAGCAGVSPSPHDVPASAYLERAREIAAASQFGPRLIFVSSLEVAPPLPPDFLREAEEEIDWIKPMLLHDDATPGDGRAGYWLYAFRGEDRASATYGVMLASGGAVQRVGLLQLAKASTSFEQAFLLEPSFFVHGAEDDVTPWTIDSDDAVRRAKTFNPSFADFLRRPSSALLSYVAKPAHADPWWYFEVAVIGPDGVDAGEGLRLGVNARDGRVASEDELKSILLPVVESGRLEGELTAANRNHSRSFDLEFSGHTQIRFVATAPFSAVGSNAMATISPPLGSQSQMRTSGGPQSAPGSRATLSVGWAPGGTWRVEFSLAPDDVDFGAATRQPYLFEWCAVGRVSPGSDQVNPCDP